MIAIPLPGIVDVRFRLKQDMMAFVEQKEDSVFPDSGFLCLHAKVEDVLPLADDGSCVSASLVESRNGSSYSFQIMVDLGEGKTLAVTPDGGPGERLVGRLGGVGFFFDTTASRFHPASIAGLVVGAMGCFIFGLYLRAWLRERTARASELPEDMIA